MAGLGFSETEAFLLKKSIEKLAKAQNSKTMRFWGKIRGTEKDYFVAVSQIDVKVTDTCPPGWEKEGTGVNRLSFFVTNDRKIPKNANF